MTAIVPGRTPRLLFFVFLAVAVLVAAAAIVVPAGGGWDFANFYDTGRRALAGQLADIYNPGSAIAGETPQGRMAFWGAPISAWFYAPLGLFPPGVALVLLKLAGTIAYAAGLILLYRLLRPFARRADLHPAWFLAVFTGLILLYQPFWTVYRVGGQTTPFVFLLLVMGLLAYLRQQMVVVACLMLLVVLLKPAFALVPLFLLLFSGRRYALALVAAFAVTGLLSLALVGVELHGQFLDIVRRGSGKPSPWPFNSSIYILADAFRPIANDIPVRGAGGWFPDALRIALKLIVLGTFVRLMAMARHQVWSASQRRMFCFLAAIAFCLLFSQVVWEHYLSMLFIPLAFLVAGFSRLSRAGRWHLGIIFGLAVLQNLVLVMLFRDQVQITSTATLLAVSLVKAGPLIGMLLFLWLREKELFDLIGLELPRAADPAQPAAVLAADAVM